MYKNHLKIAFRQLSRNKVFSTLNILGLSLGMALAILIFTFINSEFSYDTWMADSDRTYRVIRMREGSTAWTPGQLAQKLMTDYPEVEVATGYTPIGEHLLNFEGKDLYVDETALVDSTFFQVMKMNFLHGDSKTALDEPNAMVISDVLAKRIFGGENPIGQIIKYDGADDYIVSGVVDRSINKSHIISDVFKRYQYHSTGWRGNNRSTYTVLKPNTDPKGLAQKIEKDVNALIVQEIAENNYVANKKDLFRWGLQPLEDIYLHSEGFTSLIYVKGSIRKIYIFGFIAFLVLLVAMINYINLTTARASQRGMEVGVKKVAGAERGMLTTQFIVESLVQTMIAGVIALMIAEMWLPLFNKIMDRELQLLGSDPLSIILGTVVLALVTGFIAGSYPAFVMSAFSPALALKSKFLNTGGKGLFRKALVTGQFAVSITMLIVMAFIYRQVNYMMDEDLGFQADQVITIPMSNGNSFERVHELKSRFKQIPGVEEVSTASTFPGNFLPDWPILIEGQTDRSIAYVLFADGDFDECLNIEMVAGRFMDDAIQDDTLSNYVVNEEFVKRNNIENPIGHKIKFDWQESYGQIVGVMKNFHYKGLADNIEPMVMNSLYWRSHVGVKIAAANMPKTIAAIEKIWKEVEPTHPMRHSFLDETFAQQYADQKRFGKTVLYASLLTIFIALLGLFGLTAFTVERRTREIGIRKVLGASVGGIIGLLAKDFVQLIVLAAFIAIPLSYVVSNYWLSDFAHRTDLVWWVFAGAGLIILFVGFATVCIQGIRAAWNNPIDSLRSE